MNQESSIPRRFSCPFIRGNREEYTRYGCYFPAEDQSVWENGQVSKGHLSRVDWIDPPTSATQTSGAAAEPPRRGPKPTVAPDRTQGDPIPRPDGTPRTGRALFAWARKQEEEHGAGLLKYLAGWGKLQGFPGRIVDWTGDQAALGYHEASRKLGSVSKSNGNTAS